MTHQSAWKSDFLRGTSKLFIVMCMTIVFYIGYHQTQQGWSRHLRAKSWNFSPSVATQAFQPIVVGTEVPEQIGGGLRHFLYFTAVAKHLNGRVVQPFLAGSRLRFNPTKSSVNLSKVFNEAHFNTTLISNGYSSLITYEEYRNECKSIDVALFMTHPIDNKSISDTQNVQLRAGPSQGWARCSTKAQLDWDKHLLGINVSERVCVDNMVIVEGEKLREIIYTVNPNARCIGFTNFAGKGHPVHAFNTYNFPYPKSIRTKLLPADLQPSEAVLKNARSFVAEKFAGERYIAVHIRGEYSFMGIRAQMTALNITVLEDTPMFKKYMECLRELSRELLKKKSELKIKHTVLATDMKPERTSDTSGIVGNGLYGDQRKKHFGELLSILGNPVVSRHEQDDIQGNAEDERMFHAMIETMVIAGAKHLLLMGGGQYQRYIIIDNFLKTHDFQGDQITTVCSGRSHDWLFFPDQE